MHVTARGTHVTLEEEARAQRDQRVQELHVQKGAEERETHVRVVAALELSQLVQLGQEGRGGGRGGRSEVILEVKVLNLNF